MTVWNGGFGAEPAVARLLSDGRVSSRGRVFGEARPSDW